MPVILHIKSHYSLGEGSTAVEDLVRRVAEAGFRALALTDLENLYGQVLFHHACRRYGLKPITGVELRRGFDGRANLGERAGRWVILARNREGYENLCRIVSRRRTTRHGAAAGTELDDPLRAASQTAGGLVFLTDDPAALENLLSLGGVDHASLGLLLVRPAPSVEEAEVIHAARTHDVPLVADPDIVLLDPADRPIQALRLAIQRRQTVQVLRDVFPEGMAARPFPNREEMERLYADVPEAIRSSDRIAEECHLDLTEPSFGAPDVDLPPGESAASRLERLCRDRLAAGIEAGRWRDAAYGVRLDHELETIHRLGLDAYFVAVAEIVGAAQEKGIEVAGRGSAAGSLVCHLLRATPVDPVGKGLLFERFLHDRKRGLPDVDIDVCSRRRDEFLEWVFRRFGDRVALASSMVTFRRRSAYREGLKALGMGAAQVDRFCRRLPSYDLPDTPEPPPVVSLLPASLRAWVPTIERLIGKPQHLATHPGGVVITDRPIERVVPLERAPKGWIVAQYDAQSLDRLGLIKIDLLGNWCLSELRETIELLDPDAGPDALALRNGGIDAIPDHDTDTFRLLDRGDTLGCFQLESPAMRSVLTRLPIRAFDDLVAALAIVRPGPASEEAKNSFVRRARGEEAVGFAHPRLAARLAGTHGILLYEEDLMGALREIGGVSLAAADELRQALQEAEEPAELELLKREFLSYAGENGIESSAAHEVWQDLVKLAAYSFSKAHAASYAILGYRAAYMKTHFPAEFGCALIENHGGMYPLRTIAAEIARRGVTILPPSVCRSEIRCTVERGHDPGGLRSIRLGLGRIKRLTQRSARAILLSRRSEGGFRDVQDLLRRIRLSSGEIAALVLCGACDDLAPLSESAYPFAHEWLLERVREGGVEAMESAELPAYLLPSSEPSSAAAGNGRLQQVSVLGSNTKRARVSGYACLWTPDADPAPGSGPSGVPTLESRARERRRLRPVRRDRVCRPPGRSERGRDHAVRHAGGRAWSR